MIEIYNYINYRQFLKDFFEEQKTQAETLTQRAILQKMGISSSGFLANVLSGKNSLTIEQVKCLAGILKLSENEARYFKYMVYFDKAKAADEKNDFFETLNSLRRKKLRKLNKSQLSLFTKWYYVVIRELLNFYRLRDDFAMLARMVNPRIKPTEAEEAISALEQMGFIKKDENGYYRQTDTAISTGDEVQSFLVAKFQLSMMDLGKRALEKVPVEERDISGLTLTLSPESFKLIKAEIQEFRKRISRIAVDEQSPIQVFRCNFQMFPVSQKSEGEE